MRSRLFDGIPFVLQPRDIAVLRSLLESRVLTSAHVSILHFDGKTEATKKRLQKLRTAGLVIERPRKPYEPAILSLTRRALTVLQSGGVLQNYPPLDLPALERRARVSNLTIHHELEVMDVKVAFHSSLAQSPALSLAEFSTWPLLYKFEAFRTGYDGSEVMVKPDGFIRIHERERDGGLSEHTFFVEVDRSSETQDTLVTRAGCYLDYYKSGGFAVRHGAPRTAFKEFPFRVLMIFKTAERRNNTAERLLQHTPPILTQVYLSTLEQVTQNPLGNVWLRPIDYREAAHNTEFATATPGQQWRYRRQKLRDLFVDTAVHLVPLFGKS